MAVYLSFPVVDQLLWFVENDSMYEDAVKAMVSGILNYYFPITSGHIVAPEQYRDHNVTDFIVLRITRCFPGDEGVIDHTLAEARRSSDPIAASLHQLENALEQANTEFGRCWAFFNPWSHHGILRVPQLPTGGSTFFLRFDHFVIDWMLRHMANNDIPLARWATTTVLNWWINVVGSVSRQGDDIPQSVPFQPCEHSLYRLADWGPSVMAASLFIREMLLR